MVSDTPPLLVRKVFGSLRPANTISEQALSAYPGDTLLRVRVTRASGNTKRMAFYWVCLAIGAENLADHVEGGVLTAKMLHHKLKRELGLATPIINKRTGEVVDHDYDSISFDTMPEHDRAQFIDAALARLSGWLGCDITDLRREGEAQTEREAA